MRSTLLLSGPVSGSVEIISLRFFFFFGSSFLEAESLKSRINWAGAGLHVN